MKKITNLLILLLTLSCAFCDLRFTGTTILYLPGELGAGKPRLAEVVAILASIYFLLIGFPNHFVNKKLRNARNFFFICSMLMALFALSKPFFLNYLRSACIIPTMLFVSLLNINVNDKQLLLLFKIIFGVITVSAFFFFFCPYVDLGVAQFYTYSGEEIAQRYIGFGLSLPYQACFNLCAIPLFFYLHEKSDITVMKIILLLFLSCNVIAVILTGTRTAYLTLLVLAWYYKSSWIKYMHGRNIIILLVVIVAISIYDSEELMETFSARHEASLSGRDIVWKIGIMLILSHPIYGIQNFFVDGKEFGHVIAHVQNGFFEMAFWGGVFSVIFHLISLAKFYKSTSEVYDIKHCFAGLLIIYIIFMMSEILFYSVQNYFVFLLLWGLLIANYQYRQRIKKTNKI